MTSFLHIFVLYDAIFIPEYSLHKEPINPCSEQGKDFSVIKPSLGSFNQENEDDYSGLQETYYRLKRVNGCCKDLNPFLSIQNLPQILNLMKYSIGMTIPQSPFNSNNRTKLLSEISLLQPPQNLKAEMRKRYLRNVLI